VTSTCPAAPCDRQARIATSLIWTIVVLLWAAAGGALAHHDTGAGVVLTAAAVGMAALAVFFRRRQPVAYRISRDELVIQRRAAADRVLPGPVGDAHRARLGLRLLGSGGLYGYLGAFRLEGGGRVRSYVTDQRRVVTLAAGPVRVAVSPDDPGPLLAEFGDDDA
jgi:Bacterial PH domain